MACRSELVALNLKDFEIQEDGSARVTFERLKAGVQATNYLSPEVMAVMREWLTVAHIEEGAVFNRHRLRCGPEKGRDDRAERQSGV